MPTVADFRRAIAANPDSLQREATAQHDYAWGTYPWDMRWDRHEDSPRSRANLRREVRDARARRLRVLRVLRNGPWPVRLAYSLADQADSRNGHATARICLGAMLAAGLVREYSDDSGELVYALGPATR